MPVSLVSLNARPTCRILQLMSEVNIAFSQCCYPLSIQNGRYGVYRPLLRPLFLNRYI